MTTVTLPDRWALAGDILAPPAWQPVGRPPLEPHQTPPDGPWDLWILLAGRGAGKTEACSRYFARYMRRHPGHRGRIIAPTLGDAVESCVLGPSGLKAMDPEIRYVQNAAGGSKVVWPNGSEAVLIGTHTPREVERLRALGNRHIDWWEEMAANPQLDAAWVQADLGLRSGPHPHSIASTTPRTVSRLKKLLKRATTAITRGTVFDNPHLDDATKAKYLEEYEGTRMGRQELYGELLEDIEGALWTWAMIEQARGLWTPDPDFTRAGIAVDPAVTSGEDSDVVGIIGGGRRVDGLGAISLDRSIQGVSPLTWAKRAVQAFDDLGADRLIAETNNGGELVELTIRNVRPGISYKAVHASRGKRTRAEPVAAQFEQGKWALGPDLDELAEELTGWDPDAGGESPGRLDAMVWLATWLMPPRHQPARTSAPKGPLQTTGPLQQGTRQGGSPLTRRIT